MGAVKAASLNARLRLKEKEDKQMGNSSQLAPKWKAWNRDMKWQGAKTLSAADNAEAQQSVSLTNQEKRRRKRHKNLQVWLLWQLVVCHSITQDMEKKT
jgi:hypothetical protein